MRISHDAIYQALYIQVSGALQQELILCLRALRTRSRRKTWAHVTPEALISDRPAEAEDRAVPGHWEGDLIIGLERSAIGTVVERSTRFTRFTRFTILVHLSREEGYGTATPTKNEPALAGYGAISIQRALANTMASLPAQLTRSLTWDRGKDMSAHAHFKVGTDIPVFVADPHSPWQRGTNKNTNGLLRQYFPKGTDLSRWTAEEIEAVAHAPQHEAPQDTRLDDTGRGVRRAPNGCLNKPMLNPVNTHL